MNYVGLAKNISNNILAKLNSTVESLEEEKQKRLEKVTITYAVVPVLAKDALVVHWDIITERNS